MYNPYPNASFFFAKKPNNRTLKRPMNRSRSNHSNQQRLYSQRKNPIFPVQKILLTKKQKDIRQAIAYRYAKSKMRQYKYSNNNVHNLTYSQQRQRNKSKSLQSSRSSQMKEYKELKGKIYINLKQFHTRQNNFSIQLSKSKNLLRIKLRQNNSRITKTQGNLSENHSVQKERRPQITYLNGTHSTRNSHINNKRQQQNSQRIFSTIQYKEQQQTRSVDTKGKIASQKIIQNQITMNAKRRELKNPGRQQVGWSTPKGNKSLKQNFMKI